MSETPFTEAYYERGMETGLSLYSHYRWLPDLTLPMCEALVRELGITKEDSILDFGCAKGYVVKALRQMGYLAWGEDVSEYAIANVDSETRAYCVLRGASDFSWGPVFDWILAKDVLEHLEEAECLKTLKGLRESARNLFIAVPLGDGHNYIIPDMERDVTHKIRQPLWWWSGLVEEAGFKIVSAKFSMPGVKENWTRKWPFGNGFIVAK